MFGIMPKISPEFILADLSLTPEHKRRFTEFSGDLSGRYLSAFSKNNPDNNPVDIHLLIDEALQYQHEDGRFGNADLSFDSEKLDGPQMALLWGNGRFLVGLMDYYIAYRRPEVLEAGVKLGNFLVSITDNLLSPEVVERLKGKNATGYICFTQLMEGLVLLWDETKKKEYIEAASLVYTLLPERGKQHSHGYLNTLLGTLMLYNRTGEPEQLKFVTERYNDLINSPDYLVSGGVPEYFGSMGVVNDARDEGCSEADLVMLSLRLWRTTGEMKYLERAEHCLINHLFPNQFQTGDFGHHFIEKDFGFRPAKNVARSWWCCNFHALRALDETERYVFSKNGDTVTYNLFFTSQYSDSNLSVSSVRVGSNKFTITINKTGKDSRLAIRRPAWAKNIFLTKGNRDCMCRNEGNFIYIDEQLCAGDEYNIEFEYKIKLYNKKKEPVELPVKDLTEAAFFYGPYLMCVDDIFQPFFDAEPNYSNYIVLDGKNNSVVSEEKCKEPEATLPFLEYNYYHTGMFGKYPVIMRPFCETTFQAPCNTRVWFNVLSEHGFISSSE